MQADESQSNPSRRAFSGHELNVLEAQERIEALTDLNPNPLIEIDGDMQVNYSNLAAKMKFPELEKLGKKHPLLQGLTNVVIEVLEGSSKFVVFSREAMIEQDIYEIQIFATPKNKRIYLFINDVTQKRKEEQDTRTLEHQLFHAHKMEAIGQLTGGIAHDFNNILTVIQGNLQLLQSEALEHTKEMQRITAALEAVERGSVLSKRLLTFSSPGHFEPTVIELPAFLESMESLIKPAVGNNIRVIRTYSPSAWKIFVDANQLENALLNLIVNARDAMDHRGTLEIKIDNVTLKEKTKIDDTQVRPGEYLKISLCDTGTGIAEEDLPNIFDPFFTTKALGKGTGLGLSQVYGFVKQSKGYIMIDTELGQGTCFHLHFPRILS